MGYAQWESYRIDVRRRLAVGEDVDRLVSIIANNSLPPLWLQTTDVDTP